jgi:CRP-like cAMP-binding protein
VPTRGTSSTQSEVSRPKNRLLARLPPEDFARIQAHLTTVPTKVRQVFHKRGEPIREVFFPNGGVASVTAGMRDGEMVEVATVGDEGMVGINAFFGGDSANVETLMQVPDTSAEMMDAESFRQEMEQHGAFYELIRTYCDGLMGLIMQSTACMALHPVQERCARWLLMTHDRVRRDDFELSHEFLAMMLGSTRPTVTIVAGSLQEAGLIRYRHGRITIVDRSGLEASACECYATVRRNFERLGL